MNQHILTLARVGTLRHGLFLLMFAASICSANAKIIEPPDPPLTVQGEITPNNYFAYGALPYWWSGSGGMLPVPFGWIGTSFLAEQLCRTLGNARELADRRQTHQRHSRNSTHVRERMLCPGEK